MPSPMTKLGLAFVIMTSLLVNSCGGKTGRSASVSMEINPKSPIVITADTALHKAPWFLFKVTMTNSSDVNLRIIALVLEISISDNFGQVLTGELGLVGSDLNSVYSTDTRTCTYSDLGLIGPGETKELFATNVGDAGCPTNFPFNFVAGGLPRNKDIKSFRYRIKATPQGWFSQTQSSVDGSGNTITREVVLDRFTGFKVFHTQ